MISTPTFSVFENVDDDREIEHIELNDPVELSDATLITTGFTCDEEEPMTLNRRGENRTRSNLVAVSLRSAKRVLGWWRVSDTKRAQLIDISFNGIGFEYPGTLRVGSEIRLRLANPAGNGNWERVAHIANCRESGNQTCYGARIAGGLPPELRSLIIKSVLATR